MIPWLSRRRPLIRTHTEDIEPVPDDQKRRLCALSMAQAGGHELGLIGTPRMVFIKHLIAMGRISETCTEQREERGR